MRYTEKLNLRPTPALGPRLFLLALRSLASFDTTLAGMQPVHPCMRYTEKLNLRPTPGSRPSALLASTSLIGFFRYNARRHAASTSLYALHRKAELARDSRLPALGSSC